VDFLLLGPLEVRDGERVVALSRKKQRAVLALLLLRAGEVVSADVLVEELWGSRPPKTAREALHNYVSQLRKELGAELIETREPGYVLHVGPDQLDLGRFERLVGEARAADSAERRAAKLRAAVELWRGPALADLAYEPFAAAESQRLDELRLVAREDLVDVELELGRAATLVPELESLVDEHPFRERLRGQLMLALYRAGRQGDALDAYRAARRALVDELGIEPGAQLRELERAILAQDPGLDVAVALPSVEERRKTVTVLFCELSPTDALDPERQRRQTVRALAEARAAIELHGGSVETRAGDELLGVFGIPAAHEDDALRAVRAAGEMRDSAAGLRVGTDTGEVLAGYGFVSGDVVTRAKRLQRGASSGEALIGEATFVLCRDAIEVEAAEGGFRLVGVEGGARPVARDLDAPLVGRKRELAALRRAYTEAREGSCRVVAIVGEPGIGKTRLARELVADLGNEATVLVGRCVSYGSGATWLPLAEMLQQAGERLEPILARAGSPGEVFLETRRVFERLAAERPLVLVFDDVHWAEPTLLDFVEYLGERAEGRILCACLARPELGEARPALVEEAIRLGPLAGRQAEALAAGVEPELRARVVEAAGGNPLFLEQLVAFASEGGAVDVVPPSVEALLAARLDLLEREERALLQRAAVVGRLFRHDVVQELGGEVARLPGLEEKGFVRRRRTGFRFHHVLVRDVAYASLPKAERAELHEQLADWLDEHGEPDELVGYHLEQAYAFRRELGRVDGRARRLAAAAGARLGAAGIEAWKRGEAPATVNLLGRATDLLPERETFRLELLCELGLALRAGGELSRAEETLIDAVEAAAAAGDPSVDLRAQLELARVRLFSNPEGRADELLDIAARAIPVFEAVGNDHSLGRVWLTLAVVHGPMHCRHGTATEEVGRAIDYLRRSGWPISACLGLLAAAVKNGPTPVPEAIRRCRKLLAGADFAGQANVLAPLGALEAMRGRFDEARRHVAQARTVYDELGQTSTAEANCGAVAGRIELLAGDLAAAELAFRSTCQTLERVDDQAYLATGAAELADVLCIRGRFDEAEQWCLLASRLAASDDVFTQVLWRATWARLLARKGEFDEAEALAREALRRMEETDDPNWRAKVLVDFSDVLRVARRPGDAAEAVEAAVELFERKGNVVAAKRTRALLAELSVA
jgi:DNA-binding SARP family transcriptional activator/tetratricopeptide (TPR) repeat protein